MQEEPVQHIFSSCALQSCSQYTITYTPAHAGRRQSMYECDICGYVYDPAENNGVAWEDLPDDWTCPLCGAGKDSFTKQD